MHQDLRVPPPRRKFTMMSSTCACRIEGAWKYSPAAAVPVSTKMPGANDCADAQRRQRPRAQRLLQCVPGASDSEISLSMDLQQKSWLSEVRTTSLDGGSLAVVVTRGRILLKRSSALGADRRAPSLRGFRGCGSSLLSYRFAWPRANFLTFGFFDPRG